MLVVVHAVFREKMVTKSRVRRVIDVFHVLCGWGRTFVSGLRTKKNL